MPPDCLLEPDEINQLREQLETERRAFEASRVVWNHQRERQEQHLLAQENELQLREREIEQQRQLLDRERQAWEQRTADLVPQTAVAAANHDASSRGERASANPIVSSSETPSEAAEGTDYDPIAALEQLRRMVEAEEEEEPQDEAIQPIAPAHRPADHIADNDKNEESIDDYMSKLMSRVNGKSDRIGAEPITPVPSVADTPTTSAVSCSPA